MLDCYARSSTSKTIPITPFLQEEFSTWLAKQKKSLKNWCTTTGFSALPDTFCLVPNAEGELEHVLLGVNTPADMWAYAGLSYCLPKGCYHLEGLSKTSQLEHALIAWGLGAYQFSRYKKPTRSPAKVLLARSVDADFIESFVKANYWVKDLINTPTDDMGPLELAKAAQALAKEFGAKFSQIVGEDLLTKNYPAIYTVGRASRQAPRLLDLRWGKSKAFSVTLIGKGVCFDSGGLDLKPASAMALMKKDMAGAAHALGLARLLMAASLPIKLRVLIPAVENAIGGGAYHPGDVITMRNGSTVEVGNTDTEGRLVLADALAEAVAEKPDLIIDFSTLTGAARVAVGTEITALFTHDDALATALVAHGTKESDPIWRLPLYKPYRKLLDSSIATINNAGNSPYAGAITAALFLQSFVPTTISWAHLDFMAWNVSARPGRPEGAEVMALRAIFSYLRERCA